jgi:hypothetical protein
MKRDTEYTDTELFETIETVSLRMAASDLIAAKMLVRASGGRL